MQADYRGKYVSPNEIQVVPEARRESAGDVDSGERRVSGDFRSRAVWRRAGGDPSAIETLLQWGGVQWLRQLVGYPPKIECSSLQVNRYLRTKHLEIA